MHAIIIDFSVADSGNCAVHYIGIWHDIIHTSVYYFSTSDLIRQE